MSAYTEIPKIIAGTGELPPKVLGDLNSRYAQRAGSTTYWVHPEGSDTTGDGTEQNPFATINHAIALAERVVLDRSAAVNIRLFPTTYTETVRFAQNTGTNLNINIYGHPVGGHPNTPTTIFQGNADSATAIYSASPSATIRAHDIKFVDYPNFGIQIVRGNLYTTNVHYENCSGGARLTNGSLDVKGGILTNVGYDPYTGAPAYAGIISFMANRHSIGSQHGDLSEGPFFYGGYRGVVAQEVATGHVDYCTFEDLEIAVTSNRSSSINPDGSSFKRNGIDLRAINAASIVAGNRVQFGTGSDASDQNMQSDATSIINTGLHWSGVSSGRSISERLHTEITETQTLNSDSLSLARHHINPSAFHDTKTDSLSPTKALVYRSVGEITNPGGRLRFSISLDGTAAFVDTPNGAGGHFTVEAEIIFRNRHDQALHITCLLNGQPVMVRTTLATVDVTTNPEVVFNVRRLDSTGTADIHSTQTWMRGL